MTASSDTFHAHLDACEQCRNEPFNLCPEGAKVLAESVEKLNDWLDNSALLPPFMQRRPRWP